MSAPYGSIKYKRLKQSHPSLNLFQVDMLHALYRGGSALFGNKQVFEHVFPKHAAEGDNSYAERKARAHYENVFAQVINQIVAGLAQDPIRFEAPKPEDDAAAKKVDDGPEEKPAELDDYWEQIALDATPPLDDTPAKTYDQVIRAAVCEALVARFGWVLCDMPALVEPPPASTLEQEQRGELYAYPVLYSADQITDWYEKDNSFVWVRAYTCEVPADDFTKPRDKTQHTWTFWTRLGWVKYVLLLDKDGKDPAGTFVDDEYDVQPTTFGTHGFGRVPWVCFDANACDEPSLWIGDLIESQVRSLFNQSCGESFQRLRHMFQQLYEFLGKELPGIDEDISDAQKDPNRAKRRRGPDIVQERGQDDDAKFVSPDMSGAAINQAGISDAREGILRVTGQLALSQDTSGAMLRRSGDSKRQDKIETLVVLGAVGKRAIAFARALATMLALGRKDAVVPNVRGYEEFDVDDVDDIVGRAVMISTIGIKSATFEIEHQYRTARAVLGDDTPQSVLDAILDDLKSTITQDQFEIPDPTDMFDMEDDGDEPPVPKPSKKPPPKKAAKK